MSKLSLATVVAIAIAASASPSAEAQVGHDPADSPYQDLRDRTNFVATAWAVRGSGGQLEIGPRNGEMLGLRYEMRLSGPTDAFLGLSYGQFERLVIDPDASEDTRVSGPVDQSLFLVDAGLNVLLTGNKTWNGLIPYVGGTLGLGFGGDVPSDSSGFGFNAKLVSGPQVGVRFYPTRSLSFRVEGRLLFWQLKYGDRFFSEPLRAPDDDPVLDPATDSDSEWTSHPTLVFAIGYAFRL